MKILHSSYKQNIEDNADGLIEFVVGKDLLKSVFIITIKAKLTFSRKMYKEIVAKGRLHKIREECHIEMMSVLHNAYHYTVECQALHQKPMSVDVE